MERNEIYQHIQKNLQDVPLMVIGTGGTIPYGIPGMNELADYILNTLNSKYLGQEGWENFSLNLKAGKDLESALNGINLSSDILDDIVVATWTLINKSDLVLFERLLDNKELLPITKLINKFYYPSPQNVNIITTNYDRVIEYACDQIGLKVNNCFSGYYRKTFDDSPLIMKNIVNLVKVHGSLDWFKDESDYVVSIPLQNKIPKNFIPELVTPGENKYKSIMNGEYRNLVHISDDLIKKASAFLCIGYGFNDEQIQRNIIERVRLGTPIVIVTKSFTNESRELIRKNATKYIIIQEDKNDASITEIEINGDISFLEGKLWDLNEFLEIL